MVLKIKNPMEDFEENLEKAKKIMEEVNKVWEECEKEKKEEYCEDAVANEQKAREEIRSMLSTFLILEKLKEKYPLKEGEVYDVDKIYVNEKDFEKMRKYDLELLKTAYKDILTARGVEQQLGMLYLDIGFKVSNNVEEGKVDLMKDFIIRKN